MVGQRDLRCGQQPRSLPRTQCRRRVGQAGARFHLDEGQQAGALGHQVDLAGRGTEAPGEYQPSILMQGGAAGGLGIDTQALRGPAAANPGFGQGAVRPSSIAWQATSTGPECV